MTTQLRHVHSDSEHGGEDHVHSDSEHGGEDHMHSDSEHGCEDYVDPLSWKGYASPSLFW